MLVASAIIFKAIIDIEKTKSWFGQIAGVLSPFIFGALLAYILNPMVRVFYHGMELLSKKFKFRLNKTVHKILAILITYVIVLGFAVLILVYILPEVMNNIVDFVNFIPGAYNSLLKQIADLQQKFPDLDIEAITKPITDAVPDLITTLRNFATNMVPAIYSVSMWIANWIVNLLITIIVSIYMLYDKKRLMRSCWKIIYAFLPQKRIPACHEILSECNRLFSSFVTGKFIDSAIIGVLCFIGLRILDMPYTMRSARHPDPAVCAAGQGSGLCHHGALSAAVRRTDPRPEDPRRVNRYETAVDHFRDYSRRKHVRRYRYVPRCSGCRDLKLSA